MNETRNCYVVAVKTNTQCNFFLPKQVTDALGIENRDELELVVRKTGRSIPIKRPNAFKKKIE